MAPFPFNDERVKADLVLEKRHLWTVASHLALAITYTGIPSLFGLKLSRDSKYVCHRR